MNTSLSWSRMRSEYKVPLIVQTWQRRYSMVTCILKRTRIIWEVFMLTCFLISDVFIVVLSSLFFVPSVILVLVLRVPPITVPPPVSFQTLPFLYILLQRAIFHLVLSGEFFTLYSWAGSNRSNKSYFWSPGFSPAAANPNRALLEDCMRVLFYRDCRALNRIQIAKATAEGTVVSDPYTVSRGH